LLVLLSCTGAFGCGDDDDDSSDAGDDGGAGKAGKGGGGTGGNDADGGGGTGGGGLFGDAGIPNAPVTCGGTMCSVPARSLLQACCVEDACGLGLLGTCQLPDMPGELDSTCPDHTSGTSLLKGCCKPDNQCGVMSVSGLGCIERTKLASYAGGPLDAMECGGEGDAGTLDGGS
jgi:hypothetical protein